MFGHGFFEIGIFQTGRAVGFCQNFIFQAFRASDEQARLRATFGRFHRGERGGIHEIERRLQVTDGHRDLRMRGRFGRHDILQIARDFK